MRHETCLNCLAGTASDANVQRLILVSESLTAAMHHHHTVRFGGCGWWWWWWFDNVTLNGRASLRRAGAAE